MTCDDGLITCVLVSWAWFTQPRMCSLQDWAASVSAHKMARRRRARSRGAATVTSLALLAAVPLEALVSALLSTNLVVGL